VDARDHSDRRERGVEAGYGRVRRPSRGAGRLPRAF